MSEEFEGFKPPIKNYFPMPNEWIDICAEIKDISELKVIQYILRHTWGFREYGICKTISVDEFMHGRRRQDQTRMDKGTGLSEQSVRNGLNKAIKDGYLICDIDPSDAGRIKKSYALRMQANIEQVQSLDPPQTLDLSTGLKFIPQGTNLYTSDSQSLDPRVPNFIPRSEKDTLERHLEKDTLETQEREGVFASAQTPHARIVMSLEEEISLAETIGHDFERAHHVINCAIWQRANHGTCADYQAAINGGLHEAPTEPRIEAIQHTPSQSEPGDERGHPQGIGTASAPASVPPQQAQRAGEATVYKMETDQPAQDAAKIDGKPRRPRKKPTPVQLSLQEQGLKTWYEELREMEVSFSKRNVAALQSLAKKKGTESKDNFLNIVAILDDDPWFERNKIAVDLYWIDRQWENKYMFLQRHKPRTAPATDDGKPHSDFGHSDFDRYVGNGPEEREAVYREALEREKNGTLLW